MKITVLRYSSQSQTTLGVKLIDSVFECMTLEDRFRKVKVAGETRIPSGIYNVTLRTFGGHHERYKKKFPDFHKGMLWIREVPNFTDILIHIGTKKEDTRGCLLVGEKANNNKLEKGVLTNSTKAYVSMYKKVVDAAAENNLQIEFIDLDKPYGSV